jgi:TusA-related sulfurtransferase
MTGVLNHRLLSLQEVHHEVLDSTVGAVLLTGDAVKKVESGQRLEITAEASNAFSDAARTVRENKVFSTETGSCFKKLACQNEQMDQTSIAT